MATNAVPGDDKLQYQICRYSSYFGQYKPENILFDRPAEESSRWSSESSNPPQFLLLKLNRPAIVKLIKFGKNENSHTNDLRKFQIHGGIDEHRMTLLLEGELNNSSTPEIFQLRHTTKTGENIPILYMKIVPLSTYGPKISFTVWFVELYGTDDPTNLKECWNYNFLQEIEIIKLCLKHFRQQGYDDAFKALQNETDIGLEFPSMTDLYISLVKQGDTAKVEYLVEEFIGRGLMDDYSVTQDYKHSWKLQEAKSNFKPGTRGGHQLVIDTDNHLIYLYGGWDGFRDLSDLWCYDIEMTTWSLLCENSELHGGPSPRSCHKMVFDPITANIFILGRYLDNSIRTIDYTKSEFYSYDTQKKSWLLVCEDTSQAGGPSLIYDHQMCIDVHKRRIYVFGGKVLTPRSVNQISYSAPEYSGLFSYHITTNTWQQLLIDCNHPSASKMKIPSIKSRGTHCMVFDHKGRKLYIYGGQRGREEIDDFISYDVDTNRITILNTDKTIYCCLKNYHKNINGAGLLHKNEPPSGFTQRATIDCDREEIYIFSSLSKQKDKRDIQQIESSNSFWVFSLKTNKWTQIYNSRHSREDCYSLSSGTAHLEPCPRYAHQLIYDEANKVHYLFGGNPGKQALPQLRLDDFWILHLQKPTREEIFRNCQYLLRKLRYEEITRIDPLKAMKYLQTNVSNVIDHSDPVEVKKFHELACLLFKTEERNDGYTFNEFWRIKSCSNTNKNNDNQNRREQMTDIVETQSLNFDVNSIPLNDDIVFKLYKYHGGKKEFDEYYFDMRVQRSYLFNKIVQLMPDSFSQPKANLSDFVVI